MEKQKDIAISDIKENTITKDITKLPVIQQEEKIETCNFQGYDIDNLMKETCSVEKINNKKRYT